MEIEFKIDDFEGPLDLLLHLIKENKMNILDIEIEKIAEQYLMYLSKMEEMNLEVTSNYLVMASELLYIKSKMLLPPSQKGEEEEEHLDPREELVQRLLEYQTYKDITQTLKERENLRKEIYTKMPDDVRTYLEEDVSLTSDVGLDDLVEAFKKFLIRKEEEKPLKTKVTEKEITVSERKKKIKSILQNRKKVSFFELFEEYSKEYVVATFLAILEMAKEKELRIVQEKAFQDIICEVVA